MGRGPGSSGTETHFGADSRRRSGQNALHPEPGGHSAFLGHLFRGWLLLSGAFPLASYPDSPLQGRLPMQP